MKNAAHTPGPWFPSGEDNHIRANTTEGHTTICEMWSTDADARLICAAPELLNALECLLLYAGDVHREDLDLDVYEQARQAIRHARRKRR